MEAARRALARHAPGRLLRRLPGPGGDDHLLGGAGRHPRRGRARSSTRAARTAGRGSRPTAAPSTLPTTGSRRCAPPRPTARSPSCARRGQRRRVLVAPLAHVPRLGPQPGGHAPARNRLPPAAGPRPLSPDQRRSDLLALPAPRRPVDGRVLLPGGLGRDRRPHALASESSRSCPSRVFTGR